MDTKRFPYADANNLRHVPLSLLSRAVADATDDELREFLFTPHDDGMIRTPSLNDPYEGPALAEYRRRDHAAFMALAPWERAPETWAN